MTPALRLRTGFEIELLAPRGSSRRALAEELAGRRGGGVRPVWHHDSEPSLVPGLGHFLHLTRGFEVCDAGGDLVCTLVDDITLVDDLDARARPSDGWYRILTDDPRLLRLLGAQTDPAASLADALESVAALWGVHTVRHGEVVRLDDASGATIALAAPQGGERERPCEVITPPLSSDHHAVLDELLGSARDRGFTVPREAAVHLHYDAAPFRSASALANLVRLFGTWRTALHAALGTNQACRRLAPLPPALVAAADGPSTFEELKAAADASGLSKFFDVNLTQLFSDHPVRDTVEVRILPGSIDATGIVKRAAFVERLLERCLDPTPVPVAPGDHEPVLAEVFVSAAAVG